jgi:hypothetical protein
MAVKRGDPERRVPHRRNLGSVAPAIVATAFRLPSTIAVAITTTSIAATSIATPVITPHVDHRRCHIVGIGSGLVDHGRRHDGKKRNADTDIDVSRKGWRASDEECTECECDDCKLHDGSLRSGLGFKPVRVF